MLSSATGSSKNSVKLLDPISQKIMLALGRDNFPFFFQFILGFAFADYPTNWHHYEWMDLLSNKTIRLLCIEASRDMAKSTVFARAYPMYRVAYHSGELGILLSGDEDLSILGLQVIKDWTNQNPYLMWLKDNRKNAEGWTMFKNNAMIWAKSIGSNPRGMSKLSRPKWAVLDDIYSDKNQRSLSDIEDTVTRTVMPMVDPKEGKVIVVGTRKDIEDVFAHLRMNKRWTFRSYPIKNAEGVPLWEARYSRQQILELEEAMRTNPERGEMAFLQEYMCQPINPKGQHLKMEWLMYYSVEGPRILHYDVVEHKFHDSNQKVADLVFYQGLDPIHGSKDVKRQDYAAIATIGWHKPTKTAYLWDIQRRKVTAPDQIKFLQEQYDKFHPVFIYVEENCYPDLKDWLRELTTLPFHPIMSIKDKVERIRQLGCHFEAKRIYIHRNMDEFRMEYLGYSGDPNRGHDDMLDAVNIAMQAVPKAQLLMPLAR